MLKHEYIRYSYTFDTEDRQAVFKWLKENKLKLKKISNDLGVSYIHLSRIMHGKRTASSTVVNKLRKMGVRFKK